ncbi:MAG: serine/threonine-protein kinase [Planctomycetota bacterium]
MAGLDDAGAAFLRIRGLPDDERMGAIDALKREDRDVGDLVERMLANETRTLPLEDAARAAANVATAPEACGIGSAVGPYRLVARIGEGGFGVVYEAEQSEPVRRRVAVKIAKPGVVTSELLARFEAEKQVVAMMSHPGIARLYDAGVTDAGVPYFAMELIPGESIVEHCERQGLDVEGRIRLFLDVCAAVTHAHQRGVIHRDLKPSNILIVDEEHAQPKVIDFGIAKAMASADDPGSAVQTLRGQWVGTPAYMSPEQLTMASSAIDVRSDVFSLGAILYELLSGSQALAADAIASAGFAGLSKLISEARPAAPSTVATARGRSGAGRLRGELDWIVMKALDRDRVRRYASVADLARDLRAFLDGMPVSAAPPSAMYRARKFAARHKAALSVTGACAAALTVAVGATVLALISTGHSLSRAEDAEALALMREQEAVAARTSLAEATYPGQILRASEAIGFGQRGQAVAALEACEPHLRGREWEDLWAALHPEPIEFVGMDGSHYVRGVAFSSDAALFAASSNDGTARIWGTVTRSLDTVYRGHDGMVLSVDLSPDGQRAASVGGMSQQLHLWDAGSADVLGIGEGHATWITRVRFSPDGSMIATTSDDGTVRLWDSIDAAPRAAIEVNSEGLFGLAWHPDSTMLAVAGDDGEVTIIDVAQGVIIEQRAISERSITTIAYAPDGSVLAIGDARGAVRLLESASLSEIGSIAAHRQQVFALAWHPDRPLVASASSGGTVKLHDVETGDLVGTVLAATGIVHDLCFDGRGVSLAVAHADGVPRLYDVARLLRVVPMAVHDANVLGVVRGPIAGSAVSLGEDGSLRCWMVESGALVWETVVRGDRPMMLHAAAGLAMIPFRSGLVDLASGEVRGEVDATSGQNAMRAAPAGDGVLVMTWDGVPSLIDPRNMRADRLDEALPTAALLHPDGRVLGLRDGRIERGGSELGVVEEIISAIAAIEIEGSAHLLAGTLSGRIVAIDSETATPRLFEHALSGPVRAFVVDEMDNRLIALGEDGRSTCVFDMSTGRAVEMLDRRYALVRDAVIMEDGRRVIVGDDIVVEVPARR